MLKKCLLLIFVVVSGACLAQDPSVIPQEDSTLSSMPTTEIIEQKFAHLENELKIMNQSIICLYEKLKSTEKQLDKTLDHAAYLVGLSFAALIYIAFKFAVMQEPRLVFLPGK